MSWPDAFFAAVVVVSVFAFLGWSLYLQAWYRAEVAKEAIRHGATEFHFNDEKPS